MSAKPAGEMMPWKEFTAHMGKSLTGSTVTKWPTLKTGGLDLAGDSELARYSRWTAERNKNLGLGGRG